MEKYTKRVLQLKLLKAELTDFKLTDYGKGLDNPLNGDDYEYNTSLDITLKFQEKIVEIEIKIIMLNTVTRDNILVMTSSYSYYINNMDNVAEVNEDKGIPIDALKKMVGLSIDTSRGMFLVKISDYPFKNALIPPIPAERFFKSENDDD